MTDWPPEPGIFGPADTGALAEFYRRHGFATLRGLLTDRTIAAIERECVDAQRRVIAGELPARHGSTVFLDDAAKADTFANYVEFVNELSATVRATLADERLLAAVRAVIGDTAWLRESDGFGVVYQDARPGHESGYSRIGWHSDWQASPSMDIWPSAAFTIHLDATSPAKRIPPRGAGQSPVGHPGALPQCQQRARPRHGPPGRRLDRPAPAVPDAAGLREGAR